MKKIQRDDKKEETIVYPGIKLTCSAKSGTEKNSKTKKCFITKWEIHSFIGYTE